MSLITRSIEYSSIHLVSCSSSPATEKEALKIEEAFQYAYTADVMDKYCETNKAANQLREYVAEIASQIKNQCISTLTKGYISEYLSGV